MNFLKRQKFEIKVTKI